MPDSIKIYHNPRCSKSRLTLQLLHEHDLDAEVIEYLKTPPSKQQLREILEMLEMSPRQLMRTHEAEYKENHLDDESLSDEQLIDAMIKYPKLIERPIVVCNDRAAIGRPPETVLEIV
jgi:arsenate reductase